MRSSTTLTSAPRPVHGPVRQHSTRLRRVVVIEQAGARENEALLMADRQNAVLDFGQRDQRVGFIEVGGDRLLHQHMDAGVKEGAHDRGMGDGRRADADEIDLAQKFAPIRRRRARHGWRWRRGGRPRSDRQWRPRRRLGRAAYLPAWWRPNAPKPMTPALRRPGSWALRMRATQHPVGMTAANEPRGRPGGDS